MIQLLVVTLLDRTSNTNASIESPEANEGDEEETKPLPPHAVTLHNDNRNTFEYVVTVLMRVFRYGLFKAVRLTWEAHTRGRSVIWSGSREECLKKADEVRACGPDPFTVRIGAKPLTVTVDPLPENS